MSSRFLLEAGLFALGGSFAESKYGPKNTRGPLGLSTWFGLTPLLLTGAGFWVLLHGFSVGDARTKYIEKAKKDEEEDVDERYALPNLYAQGTSIHARAFNCVQRSHQHIFESFNTVILTSLIAATSYPLAAATSTAIYVAGRICASRAYAAAEGDPSKRYSNVLAFQMWRGLLANIMLAFISSANMISGKDLWEKIDL